MTKIRTTIQNEIRNKQMIEMYAKCKDVHEVADRFGLTVTYTRAILVRYDVYENVKGEAVQEAERAKGKKLEEMRADLIEKLPIGKIFRIRTYTMINRFRTHTGYKYYIVKKHYSHCVHLEELERIDEENKIRFIKKNKFASFGPSYSDLYLMLKSGVVTNA